MISPEECDILHFIAGYLLRRLAPKCEEATMLSNAGHVGSDMIEAMDRGGLTRPDAAFVDTVIKMEETFRSMPDVNVQLSVFRSLLAENGIPAIFSDILQETNTSENSKQRFYDGVTNLLFTVRAHQKCKQFMTEHKATHKVRPKALRDSLPK